MIEAKVYPVDVKEDNERLTVSEEVTLLWHEAQLNGDYSALDEHLLANEEPYITEQDFDPKHGLSWVPLDPHERGCTFRTIVKEV